MKEFLQLMRRFVSPYKKYIGWAILLNILSAVFNVFSFTFLIPILSILFKTEGADKVYHFMEWGSGDLADVAKNNFYYYISQMIVDNGPTVALIFLGLFLMVMTLFKTGCYFASSAVMIPLRTGVVRDIRIMVYAKVMRLPMSFFSEERKGDIIARMSGDVGEVENSITSSLDMYISKELVMEFSTSPTSPLIRAMISPFLSSEKKDIGRRITLAYTIIRISRTTPVRNGIITAEEAK